MVTLDACALSKSVGLGLRLWKISSGFSDGALPVLARTCQVFYNDASICLPASLFIATCKVKIATKIISLEAIKDQLEVP